MINISKKLFEYRDEFGRKIFLKKATQKEYYEFLVNNHRHFYLLNGKIIAMNGNDNVQKIIANIKKISQNFDDELVFSVYEKLSLPFDKFNVLKPNLSLNDKDKSGKNPFLIFEIIDEFNDKFLDEKITLYQSKLSIKSLCFIKLNKKEVIFCHRLKKKNWQMSIFKDDKMIEFKSGYFSLNDIYRGVELSNH